MSSQKFLEVEKGKHHQNVKIHTLKDKQEHEKPNHRWKENFFCRSYTDKGLVSKLQKELLQFKKKD